jgi:hypothetical protein
MSVSRGGKAPRGFVGGRLLDAFDKENHTLNRSGNMACTIGGNVHQIPVDMIGLCWLRDNCLRTIQISSLN